MLSKRIDNRSDNNDDNNANFDDSDDDDDDDDNNNGGDELRQRYNNLRRQTISVDTDEEELLRKYNNLKRPLNSEEELLRWFNNLKAPPSNNDEELLHRYNDLRTPLFQDVPPSPPPTLRRPDIEREYDDTFLPVPQNPTTDALKTVFDRPITNLIDKANNIIKIITKNEKKDLEKYDLHLSEQLSKLFLEKEDGGSNLNQEDDQK